MDTKFRDDAVSKYRLSLRIAFIWAITSSIILCAVLFSGLYYIKHQKTRWLPICTTTDFYIGESGYSPSYLREMSRKVSELRLSYNPETIDARYQQLIHLAPIKTQRTLTQILDEEIKVVKEKNISSAFYSDRILVDSKHHKARVSGFLHRSSRGLVIKPEYKSYDIQFSFKHGELSPVSILEVQK